MRFAEPRRQRSAPGSFVGGWLGKVLVAGFLFLNFYSGGFKSTLAEKKHRV
jgi:hypothetical protein